MKRTSFAAMAATCLLLLAISCKKNDNLSVKEQSLELQAPSGKQIATSIQQLKAQAAQIVMHKHNSKQRFKLTGIQYLPAAEGYAAIISYALQDGTSGTFGIFEDVKLNIDPATGVDIISRGGAENLSVQESAGKVSISCRGNCNCVLSAVINTDTGVITISCGCSECSAHISTVS